MQKKKGKKMTGLDKLRQQYHKTLEMKEKLKAMNPTNLPDTPYKCYLLWKRCKAQRHNVILASNGIHCADCKLMIIL